MRLQLTQFTIMRRTVSEMMRTITVFYRDPFTVNAKPTTKVVTFNSELTNDSAQLHELLCELDPGNAYGVWFEDVKGEQA